MELIQVLKAISEETRIRILNLLAHNELCVGEIEYLLDINQPNASRHLTTLKYSGVIVFEKKAQWIYYSLNDKALNEFPFLKVLLADEVLRNEQYLKDIERLKEYKDSGKNCSDLKTCCCDCSDEAKS